MSKDLFGDTGSNIVPLPLASAASSGAPAPDRRGTPDIRPAPGADPERKLTGGMVLAGLIAFFGVIFAVNGVLVHEALSTFAGLETESSYRAGQTFEHDVAMAKAQDERHWQVDAALLPANAGATLIDIRARDAAGAALSGMDATVTLERPTDRRLDHAVAVRQDAPGHFRGSADNVPAGQWDLVIELTREGEQQFRSVNRVVLH
jgi:nitrogen fixation protein FixH